MRTAIIAATVAIVVTIPTTVAASHMFSDVPSGNRFHDDIAWMADTGISEGYADGTFRPSDAVTRQAMSAFMHRMSGTDDVAPTVNADTLRGATPDDLTTSVEQVVVAGSGDGVVHCPEGTFVVSGGYLHNGQEQHEITASHPVTRAEGFSAEGWYVGVNQNGSMGAVSTWAVCLRVG